MPEDSLRSDNAPRLLETRAGTVVRRGDGVLRVQVRAGVSQTVADAREILAACVTVCGGRRCPLLVDIRSAAPLEAEVRHLYTGEVMVEHFSAFALLVEGSPYGRMLGNIYLRVARPGIPTRLFDSEAAATDWLKGLTA